MTGGAGTGDAGGKRAGQKLEGKTALITGSSSGIGAAVAVAFAEAGAKRIVINYPHTAEKSKAEAVAAEVERHGVACLAVEADISSPDAVRALAERAIEYAGTLDILVNNAGIAHGEAVEDLPKDVWDRVIAVHLTGTYLMTQAVLPHMYKNDAGRIINTVSQLAYKGAPGLSAYTAAKGGIISFTRSLALEIGERNIRANCVAPGATMTPILEAVEPDVLDAVRAAIPTGRLAEVGDIAPSYVFLASEDGRHYQGQVISPNGGDYFL